MKLGELIRRRSEQPSVSPKTGAFLKELYQQWQETLENVRVEGATPGDEYEDYASTIKLSDPGAMSVSVPIRSGYLAEYVTHTARQCVLNDHSQM